MLHCYATNIVNYQKAISETVLLCLADFQTKTAVSSFSLK